MCASASGKEQSSPSVPVYGLGYICVGGQTCGEKESVKGVDITRSSAHMNINCSPEKPNKWTLDSTNAMEGSLPSPSLPWGDH